ncbi:head GIN domain-containing protein [Hymenobacter sp. CRA2]|uniref:head GIN domain-containing protein n=1 Tax=Hymenobacter sp. CRA2 TaxID=1955620 RepID=UPI00098F4260|nr:head GIN domain-containing protein [Hymenobacter sp. CRA2]OON67841.1 hypothetical protein B0919_16810 [Hymenobacter sp. CRA2]
MNTFRYSLAAAALVVCSSVAALAQQVRPVSSFEQVHASGAVNVVLQQGAATEVKVDGPTDEVAHIITEVQDGKLRIRHDGHDHSVFSKKDKVTVYVSCPRLTGVQLSGASDLKSVGAFTADNFQLQVSGASDVTMQLNAKQLTASASGASDIRLTGRVEQQQVHVSGASDYRAYDLHSQQATVQASGASDAYVYVDQELSARSSGASDVHYKGKGRLVR